MCWKLQAGIARCLQRRYRRHHRPSHPCAKFGPLPIIVAEGGGTWQGYSCDLVRLVELTPTGPREVADIATYYDDSGVNPDANKGTTLTGRIANIQPGKSFDVVYSGSRSFTETWVRRGDKYALAGETRMLSC